MVYLKIEECLLLFMDYLLKVFLISIVFMGIFQSSLVFMVIVIGFVSVGVFFFKWMILMILGINVGFIFIIEFIVIKMDVLIWIFLIGGLLFFLIGRYFLKQLGISFFGFGIIFFCISGFSYFVGLFIKLKMGVEVFYYVNDLNWFVLFIGMVLIVIIYLSFVCIGILMSFMNEGIIGLIQVMSVVFGLNIGICIIVVMVVVFGGYVVKQIVYVYVVFNVLGVVFVFFFLVVVIGFVEQLFFDFV